MITDIFLTRYKSNSITMPSEFFVQIVHLINDDVIPTLGFDDIYNEVSLFKVDNIQSYIRETVVYDVWKKAYKQLVRELGILKIGDDSDIIKNSITFLMSGSSYDSNIELTEDDLLKTKISLLELFFASYEQQIKKEIGFLEKLIEKQGQRPLYINIDTGESENLRALSKLKMAKVIKINGRKGILTEVNQRFKMNSTNLHYHDGVIQIDDDKLISEQITEPFWELINGSKWKNVSHDMKVAIDLRDNGGEDPPLYAAMALESTIKIICKEKNLIYGKEKGAANYIDNLVSKSNGRFIEVWESKALKEIFMLRNPHGHGPGDEPQPSLNDQQVDWIIESCMIWIKSLIKRI